MKKRVTKSPTPALEAEKPCITKHIEKNTLITRDTIKLNVIKKEELIKGIIKKEELIKRDSLNYHNLEIIKL